MSNVATVSEVQVKGKKAKAVSSVLVTVTTEEKNEALVLIAEQLIIDQEYILSENKKDLQAGKEMA